MLIALSRLTGIVRSPYRSNSHGLRACSLAGIINPRGFEGYTGTLRQSDKVQTDRINPRISNTFSLYTLGQGRHGNPFQNKGAKCYQLQRAF